MINLCYAEFKGFDKFASVKFPTSTLFIFSVFTATIYKMAASIVIIVTQKFLILQILTKFKINLVK